MVSNVVDGLFRRSDGPWFAGLGRAALRSQLIGQRPGLARRWTGSHGAVDLVTRVAAKECSRRGGPRARQRGPAFAGRTGPYAGQRTDSKVAEGLPVSAD